MYLLQKNETDYVTGEEPVTIGDETYSPSDLYLDEKAVVTLPNDAQFSDADKYLQTEIPASHPEGAVGRIIYTYNDRQIGVAWVYSTKAASAPVSAEDGTDNETAGSENTTDAAKTGTSSTADKEKKPLKLTKSNLYCCRSWCSGSPDRSCCDLVYDPEKAGRRTDACSS